MKKLAFALGSLSVLSGFAGCSPIIGKPYGAGSVYADVRFNERTDAQAAAGMKQGEGCATQILGIVATGDASAAAAAKKAGITKIATVDGSNSNVLGVYSKYCVIVTGE